MKIHGGRGSEDARASTSARDTGAWRFARPGGATAHSRRAAAPIARRVGAFIAIAVARPLGTTLNARKHIEPELRQFYALLARAPNDSLQGHKDLFDEPRLLPGAPGAYFVNLEECALVFKGGYGYDLGTDQAFDLKLHTAHDILARIERVVQHGMSSRPRTKPTRCARRTNTLRGCGCSPSGARIPPCRSIRSSTSARGLWRRRCCRHQ